MGDRSVHGDITDGSCGSQHGIYWQVQSQGASAFRLRNTYAGGDLIAANLGNSALFCHQQAEDWSTWGLEAIQSS